MANDPTSSEYRALVERFEAAYDASHLGGPYRDEAFIADAIVVFCLGAFHSTENTPQAKAAKSIASRLMGLPELSKEWRVTFPYVWSKKEDALSEAEKKRRSIGYDVWRRVEAGEKVTHAAAKVAVEQHKSTQKILADYYEWKPHHDRLKDRLTVPSSFSVQEKE